MPRLTENNGAIHEISHRKTTLGRLDTNDIHVDDTMASRQHAQIVFDGTTFFIIDNLSLNGTFLNGQRIDEAKLKDGDVIRIGGKSFAFESSTVDPRLLSGEGDTTFYLSKALADFDSDSVTAEAIAFRRKGHEPPQADLKTIREGHRNLLILHRLSQTVNATLDLQRLIETAANVIFESLDANLVSLSLTDEKTGELVPNFTKVRGVGDPPKYAFLGALADKVMSRKTALAAINPVGPGVRIGSALAAPLWARDRVIGLVYADNSPGDKAYGENEVNLLIAMSNIVAVAIENARLYRQIEENIRRIREQQTQLIQSEKLAGIGTLAAGVAHEINNPLAGIMGMAEAIQAETDRGRIIEYASEIVEYAEEAARIVRDLQSYSRASRGEGLEPVHINDVVEDALRLAGHTGLTKRIEIRKDFGEVTYIMGNAGELKQVFMNLIQNSAQAMGGTGKLAFATWMDGGRVYAKVADTGQGIPQENLDKIYDPFFTTKSESQGTGLGLNIVYRIVTKFSGEISCESSVGVGTVFTLSFPAGKLNDRERE